MRLRVLAGALVLVMVAGCGFGGRDSASASVDPAPVVSDSPSPSESPSESPSPSPSPSKTSKKPVAATEATTEPTEDPNNFQLPACASRSGKLVSKAKAKAALNAAAAKTYWPTSAPSLKVPSDLVRAVAWHESGWQSNIENCDGGYGLMQVMPDTEAFVNQRFEQSYDAQGYQQNAVIGANYLAWLTKAFGDQYFDGSYSLSAAKCTSDSSLCLLNMVIAGYNMGRGSVDEGYADKELVNPEYVGVVRALMRDCYCDRY
ncbi:lytic transglycosylase domain-containing protein [Actinoplanes sp. NPDC051851]|uniref:lytic transglycosylase domain-containing protein n=1 Tax=Actinoplanes sp. NPDC051851 TaxID=3154753 RepID=UPI003425E64A